MKKLRKWSRILHRDFGFLFVGTTLIYAISGIALNHMKDWDPNYSIENKDVSIRADLSKKNFTEALLLEELSRHDLDDQYTNHYWPRDNTLKVFLDGRSSALINTERKEAYLELVTKRPVFYQTNYLHYNPNAWWKWFSDVYAAALILFALTSLVMVRGKKGIKGRGGMYVIAGIIIPLMILFLT
jgi:hypothetical protein